MGGAGLAAPAWIWSLMSPVTFFFGAMIPLLFVRPQRTRSHDRPVAGSGGRDAALAGNRRSLLELGDLVEGELDGGLALEEGDEHGELAALRLDLADRAGQARERALLDRDRLADLEVDLGRDDPRRRLAGALRRRAALHGRLDDLHE